MGGGTPIQSSAEDDDPWALFRQSPGSPKFHSGFGTVESVDLDSASRETVLPAAGVSTIASGHPTLSTYRSLEPGSSWSVQSEAAGNYFNDFQSRDLPGLLGVNGREQVTVSEPLPNRGFETRTDETVQNTQLLREVATDLTKSAPLQHARKWIFKLMQIQNDNQDLSFVEKVILSQEEIFDLCNNLRAGSAKSSEGKRMIDFGSLDSKSMKVIGFFGSKDVLRGILETTKLTKERNIWTQIQNDTLDPGLYALLDATSVFVIYWHQGHSLPEATRKDMSCNFIRYIFDLCDTVCVCLEAKNLKISQLQDVPKFSKRQRTQRLQISLVKASEDNVKVTDGFLLKSLPFDDVNTVRSADSSKSRKNTPLKSASGLVSGHDYKLSEGAGRVALLVSSPRPRKISDSNEKKELSVRDFPSFIDEWIVDHGYSLDLRELPDSDFVVFIRCAKLQEADDLDKLVGRNESRRKEEGDKTYTVDALVDKEQENLSRRVETFVDSFLKAKYPWEENLMSPSESAVHLPVAPEGPYATSMTVQNRQSEQSRSPVLRSTSVSLIEPEMDPQCAEKDGREATQDSLNELENEIYNLLLGKDSKQRIIFPTSVLYLFSPMSQGRQHKMKGEQSFVFSIEGPNANITSKFVPICYGTKVALRCISDVSVPVKIGTLQRYECRDDKGPVLSDEDIIFSVDCPREKLKMSLKPALRTGDLSEWLNQQTVHMGFSGGWKYAALLTAISQKLGESGRGNELTESLARQTLVSVNPLDTLRPILVKPVDLEFALGKWEELRGMAAQHSAEIQQIAIAKDLKDLCVDIYKVLRSNLQSRVSAQIRKFTTSVLNQTVRKRCLESYQKLEVTLKEEEAAFLASRKDLISKRKEGTGPLTLTFQACKLREKPWGAKVASKVVPWLVEDGQKISISFVRQELEKESITWYGLELAPMKGDLDKLGVDNEHAFTPSCSASKEIIDLDPSRQSLLKVVFLKAGQLLVFIAELGHNDPGLHIYLCPKLGVQLSDSNCIRKLRRGFDLIAYDERSRFIALYDGTVKTIKTYRFDETFRHMDWIGVDIFLGEYAIGRLIWMDFVTGKNEIVFIDDLYRLRLCEVNQPGMVRSGNVHIGHSPIVKACVTTYGSCLLLLRDVSMEKGRTVSVKQEEYDNGADSGSSDCESGGVDSEMVVHTSVHPSTDWTDPQDGVANSPSDFDQGLRLDVYKLDDCIQLFTSIPLDINTKDISKLVVGLTSFASQMHLVLFDTELPSVLSSKVIKISSAAEVCQLQQVTGPDEEVHTDKNRGVTHSGPVLDYIYQIFEKYATSPPLSEQSRDLHLHVVLKGPVATYARTSLSDECLEYVKSSLDRLKREKGKDFSGLKIHTSVHDAEIYRSRMDLPWSVSGTSRASSVGIEVQMGAWMRRLVCLVPIQIARAEHNALKPMTDGLQLSGNVDYVDAISLANVIRCGLYEAAFDSWTGPVKVISSMGKQSSGKSYLLNHLSGSLLDVAGGRCTDGVWMTLRQGNGCLYVLLDFEGLGSFERSEQEDMLLSILNAAISNLTIFNKKDFHLDKETEAIFERFQNGVALVKPDPKLFRGLFYMAIKDVDISDVEDLKKEFFSKISQICSKSQDNFLTRMYGGAIEISAMPSFNRPEFHESIADIAETIQQLEANYKNGRSFLLDLKLIIAQISTKDWSAIDSKRVALRINLLRKHLQSAVSVGCFISDGVSNPLIRFDDHVEISDEPLVVDEMDFFICDTTLELTAFQEKKVIGDILLGLMTTFKSVVDRIGEKDEEWHSFFEKFVCAVVLRRKKRVLQWITLNTSDFSDDGDVQKLHLEAVALLAEVQQNLLLCSCKCERCFLRCVQEKGHPSNHSCMGDHTCVAMCTYCLEEESTFGVGPCNDAAGHAGPHDCKEKSHTCGKRCTYVATSSNCNGNCSKKSGHVGEHKCNSRQHTCNQVCSLPHCQNPCVSPIDVGDHEIHACHEQFCPVRCTMEGCNRTCATKDHFHGSRTAVMNHFCGSEHPCLAKCEHKGNCEVLTEVSKKTQTFTGRRATFEYVLVSEQNGNRKGCCIVIPPFKDGHEGPHSHSSNPDAVHFCETRCQSCGYFCTRPMEHGGLHATTHGNMRDVKFVAESEEIDIQDRKYAWGESGVAEMCQMHCKAQGRGHIHLIHCPANVDGGTCRNIFDGAQHEMRKYGPDFDLPKDEMTHAAFWEYMRFEDPCSAEEQKQFSLCNHQCKSDEHNPASGGATSSSIQNISYCTEGLWHVPIPRSDQMKFGTGYITEDGHHFSCDHSSNVAINVIFIIDRSSSMGSADIRPTMTKFSSSGHDNRLGCVYEAILRFIRTRLSSVREDIVSVILFNDAAQTVISLQEMKESLVDDLLRHRTMGATSYSTGLENAEQILSLACKDSRLSRRSPVMIFLSDGGNNGGSNPLSHIGAMKALDPKLQLHTIMFGNDPSRKILEDMAKAGDGTFEVSLDEVQLSRRFEGLAKSLRPQVASLL